MATLDDYVGLFEEYGEAVETIEKLKKDAHDPELYQKAREIGKATTGEESPISEETNPVKVREYLHGFAVARQNLMKKHLESNAQSIIAEASKKNLEQLLATIKPEKIDGYDEIFKLHADYLARIKVLGGLGSKKQDEKEQAVQILAQMSPDILYEAIKKNNQARPKHRQFSDKDLKMLRDAYIATGYIAIEYARENFEKEAKEIAEKLKDKFAQYATEIYKKTKNKEQFHAALYAAGKKED